MSANSIKAKSYQTYISAGANCSSPSAISNTGYTTLKTGSSQSSNTSSSGCNSIYSNYYNGPLSGTISSAQYISTNIDDSVMTIHCNTSIDSIFYDKNHNPKQLSETLLRELISNDCEFSWSTLCRTQKLSYEFIKDFRDKINWRELCESQQLDQKIIIDFCVYVNWPAVSRYQKLTEKVISCCSEFIDVDALSSNTTGCLTFDVLDKFKDKLNWTNISRNPTMCSNEIVKRYGDMPGFDFKYYSYRCTDLTEDVIFDYLEKWDFASPILSVREYENDGITAYIYLTYPELRK